LRSDTTAAGADLTATNDWELTADLPAWASLSGSRPSPGLDQS
jgi:hypothetical protein